MPLAKFKSQKFILKFLLVALLLTTYYLLLTTFAKADELEDISKQIEELRKAREASIAATAPLESQLAALNKKLESIQAQINGVAVKILAKETELAKLEGQISQSEKDLEVEKFILGKTVRNQYIRLRTNFPLVILLSAETAANLTRQLAYHQILARQDKEIIGGISARILDLNSKKTQAVNLKKQLEGQRERLAAVRAATDREAEFFRKEVGEAKKFQAALSGEIAKLTARQQEILGAKFGTFTTSVGDVPLPDDPAASPAFNPGFSPAFGAFSFGAFTHRKGMSQYGAWGRAKSGENFETILQKYYGVSIQHRGDLPQTISTDQGTKDFEANYLYGIAEMPKDWTDNDSAALKAQAIAARTYALYYIGWPAGSRTICTSQSCQVYLSSKASNPPEAWRKAVDDTRGRVLIGGDGKPVGAFYSSTAGGWLAPLGWDTKCGTRSCWTPEAFEKIAGSPWFYKGWYTQSYFTGSATCGRNHPWLTQTEFSDILNAWLVWQAGSDEDRKRITPTDSACWGGNPYSQDEMRNKAAGFGGAVANISGVSVVYSEGGSTANVIVDTNRGSLTISGENFKTIFNLRAPGYVAIRSPLYNIERK